jgi:recombinational DNA repair protein (RecF pathway)
VSLGDYIDVRGLTCATCGRDTAADGVSPGDGRLYCGPCWRSERPAQLTLDGVA